MNKVDKLVMCLKDVAARYNLVYASEYNHFNDELKVLFKRFNYHTRNMESKKFCFNEPAYHDIKRTLDQVECELINVFKLKKQNSSYLPEIKRAIFNEPYTIVLWEDGTKTMVKTQDEEYDPEKGLAMAISKKALGNKSKYYDVFKKWLPEEKEKEEKVQEDMEYLVRVDRGAVMDVDYTTDSHVFRVDSTCITPVKKKEAE